MKKPSVAVFLILSFCFSLCFFKEAKAAGDASLYLSPVSGTYFVDDNFRVSVLLNSGGSPVNAAEGLILYNPAEIEPISFSKEKSIFSLWTEEPTFSALEGKIVFSGGAPSNFSGSGGFLFSVVFKTKKIGPTQLVFYSGSILAADGKGTNILKGLEGGAYNVVPRSVVPNPEEVPPEIEYSYPFMMDGTPGAALVSSFSHPQPDVWYNNNKVELSWQLSSDVSAVQILLDKNPRSTPTIIYSPPISSKTEEGLADGAWYFHIRLKNENGWGAILHRKILIDTSPPLPFEVRVENNGDATEPRPRLLLFARDLLSGVKTYEIKIDNNPALAVSSSQLEDNYFTLPIQEPGSHSLIVKAIDAAGNSVISGTDFVVEPLLPPTIVNLPSKAEPGQLLTVGGTSLYPNEFVKIFIQRDGEEPAVRSVRANDKGDWLVIYNENIKAGFYYLWAQTVDSRGAKSGPTEKYSLSVEMAPFLKIGKLVISYLTVVITLVGFVLFLLIIGFYGRHRLILWQARLKKEVREAKESVAVGLDNFEKQMREEIEQSDSQEGFSEKEKNIYLRLKDALKRVQRAISKEVEDIDELNR